MADKSQSWNMVLNQPQSEFVQSFLADSAPLYQRLVAPIGSGKSVVAAAIIQELVREKNTKRILYLVDRRDIAENFRAFLEKQEFEFPVDYVDSKRYRELVAQSPLSASPWPETILVMMHLDVAVSADILETILQTKWDLVLAYSISRQASRSKVLELLLEKQVMTRMLVFEEPGQGISREENPVLAKTLATTQWTLDLKQYADASPIEFALQVVDYQRSSAENFFIENFINLQQLTKNTFFESMVRLRLASSSLYAAEQSLRQIRNKVVHQGTLSFLDEELETDDDLVQEERSSGKQSAKKSIDSTQLIQAIQDCLVALNQVSADSKYDSFYNYFSHSNHGKRLLILSSYAATISYLFSNLGENIEKVYQVTGLQYRDRNNTAIQQFRSEGGVLIASTALITGVDLLLDEVIFYDLLNNPTLVGQTIARLFIGGLSDHEKNPIVKKLITFRDTTKAIPTEEQRLRQLKKVVRQLSE